MKAFNQSREKQDSTFKIRVTQQKQSIQSLFSQFHQDLKIVPNPKPSNDKNFLSTTQIIQRRPSVSRSKDKKRMKLIDYIYIKNTAKKNGKTAKVDKAKMTATQLKKSRMKEGKEKAYKAIVDQMVSQLKQISAKAASLSQIASNDFQYTGNTEEIAKLCSIRRIIKQNILANIYQVQKLMGVQTNLIDTMSRERMNQQQQEQLDAKLRRLQGLGVQRLQQDNQMYKIQSNKCLTQRPAYKLKIGNKLSQKDTQITEQQFSQRSDHSIIKIHKAK